MTLNKEQEEWLREFKNHYSAANRNANRGPVSMEMFLEAGFAVQHLPNELKTEALCLAAVQQDGRTLAYVPDALKTETLCLAAVQQDGYTLQYVPDAQKTEALCLAAAQQDGGALAYVPDALRDKVQAELNLV